MMNIVIDRFEGNFAICEELKTGECHKLPRDWFTQRIEGDIIDFKADGALIFLPSQTRKRREEMAERFARIIKGEHLQEEE